MPLPAEGHGVAVPTFCRGAVQGQQGGGRGTTRTHVEDPACYKGGGAPTRFWCCVSSVACAVRVARA